MISEEILMIELKNISKSFNDEVLFTAKSIKLNPGTYLVTGENGSGKSTLMNMLAFECDYDGEIDLGQIVPSEISYVNQNLKLFRKLTVKQNLELFLEPKQLTQALAFAKKIKMEDILKKNRPIKKLSGGERQKLQVLIGLFRASKVLILDEFDNNLDRESINQVIKQIANQKQLYVFIISHNNHRLKEYANYEINISDKQIKLKTLNEVQVLHTDTSFQISNNSQIKRDNFKLFNKYNRWTYLFVVLATVITLAIVLNISAMVSVNIEQFSTVITEPFEPGSTIITAPRYTNQYTQRGDASWLETTEYGFTKQQYDMLNNLDYVNSMQFIPTPYIFNDLSSIKYGKKYLDFSETELETAIDLSTIDYDQLSTKVGVEIPPNQSATLGFVQLQSPSAVYEKTPLSTSGYSASELLYGTTPKDESNEIAIDIYTAALIADKQNVEVDQLIGENLTLTLLEKNIDDYQTIGSGDYKFKISGIYNTPKPYGIIYSYHQDSINTEIGVCNNPKSQTAILDCKYSLSSDPHDTDMSYMNKLSTTPLSNFGIGKSMYIQTSADDEKKLSESIKKLDPYIEVDNNYTRTHNDSSKQFYKQLRENIVDLMATILMIVIVILLMYKLIARTIKSQVLPILDYYGFEQGSKKQLLTYQKQQVAKVLAMTEIVFILLFMFKVKFYLSVFMLAIILICLVILVLICVALKVIK